MVGQIVGGRSGELGVTAWVTGVVVTELLAGFVMSFSLALAHERWLGEKGTSPVAGRTGATPGELSDGSDRSPARAGRTARTDQRGGCEPACSSVAAVYRQVQRLQASRRPARP